MATFDMSDEGFDIDISDTLTEEELEALRELRYQEQYCAQLSSESLGLWDRDFFQELHMSFENKVKELLKKYDHITSDDWKMICFALFLEYQDEDSLNELCKGIYAKKT